MDDGWPVASVEEASKLAEAKVTSANMRYMTGSGECRGTPDMKLAEVIEIVVNRDGSDGKYLVGGRLAPVCAPGGRPLTGSGLPDWVESRPKTVSGLPDWVESRPKTVSGLPDWVEIDRKRSPVYPIG